MLAYYLKPYRLRVVILGLLFGANIGLQILNPLIVSRFIDTAAADGAARTLSLIALLLLGTALATQIVGIGEGYVAEYVGLVTTNRIRADLALHCLKLDMPFQSAHRPGEMIERIDGDVGLMSNVFSRFVVNVLGNIGLLAGILIVLCRIDWRIGLPLTAMAVMGIVTVSLAQRLVITPVKEVRQASADLFGFLQERLAGTEDIRAAGAIGYTLNQFYTLVRVFFRKGLKTQWIANITWSVPFTFSFLAHAMALGLGAYFFFHHSITIGVVYLIQNYALLFRGPITDLSGQMQSLQEAGASFTRIQELFQTESAIADGSGEKLPAGALSVEFDGVSFGYNDDSMVLTELSFQLAPGRVLGLLGRTGSGKTTLTHLLFRLYNPSLGSIRLGGVEINRPHLAELRKHVGVVSQEIQLFHATVRENLTLFDATIADEKIVQIIEDLGLAVWFRSLPKGLDSMLAPDGGGLSAGEAQLLALVRVFLRDPGLVILDEPTSRLDNATEQVIQRAVERLLENRTGIVIAHRLSTVRRVDEILILDGGRIQEYGPREQLSMDSQSRFHGLLHGGLEAVAA